jgi:hypothetical protein
MVIGFPFANYVALATEKLVGLEGHGRGSTTGGKRDPVIRFTARRNIFGRVRLAGMTEPARAARDRA